MCCLKYEEETYAHLMVGMPGVGDLVRTPDGDGDVLGINILRQTAKVAVRKSPNEDAATGVYDAKDIEVLEHRPQCERNCNCPKCKGETKQ
jgi:cell fate regulator YaaT (PSP1 superfamily)